MPALSMACNSQCWSMAVFKEPAATVRVRSTDTSLRNCTSPSLWLLETSSQKQNPCILSPDAHIWHFWNTYLLKLKSLQRKLGVLLWFAI